MRKEKGKEKNEWKKGGIKFRMEMQNKIDISKQKQMVMKKKIMKQIKMIKMKNIEIDKFIEMEIEKNKIMERIEEESDDIEGGENE